MTENELVCLEEALVIPFEIKGGYNPPGMSGIQYQRDGKSPGVQILC